MWHSLPVVEFATIMNPFLHLYFLFCPTCENIPFESLASLFCSDMFVRLCNCGGSKSALIGIFGIPQLIGWHVGGSDDQLFVLKMKYKVKLRVAYILIHDLI